MVTTSAVARFPVAGHLRSGVQRARDVMRSPAVSVSSGTPITAVATLLAATRCSGVPVVDSSGVVVGLVTETDVVRHRLGPRPCRMADQPTAVEPAERVSAGEIMTSHPLLAPGRQNVGALVGLMLAAEVPVVPIVDAGRLIGTVDLRDLLGVIAATDAPTPSVRQAWG